MLLGKLLRIDPSANGGYAIAELEPLRGPRRDARDLRDRAAQPVSLLLRRRPEIYDRATSARIAGRRSTRVGAGRRSPGRTSAGSCSREITPTTEPTAPSRPHYEPPLFEYSRIENGNCAVARRLRRPRPVGCRRSTAATSTRTSAAASSARFDPADPGGTDAASALTVERRRASLARRAAQRTRLRDLARRPRLPHRGAS